MSRLGCSGLKFLTQLSQGSMRLQNCLPRSFMWLLVGLTGYYFSLAVGWRHQFLAIRLLTICQLAFQRGKEEKNMSARELAQDRCSCLFVT